MSIRRYLPLGRAYGRGSGSGRSCRSEAGSLSSFLLSVAYGGGPGDYRIDRLAARGIFAGPKGLPYTSLLHVLVNYLGALVFLRFGARGQALLPPSGSGRLVPTVVA